MPQSTPTLPNLSVRLDDTTFRYTTRPQTNVAIDLRGEALNTINRIDWSWSGPNSSSSSWTGSTLSSRFSVSSDGTRATARPNLLASNDPAGTYNWTVTFHGRGGSVSRSFRVEYNPPSSTPPSTSNGGSSSTAALTVPGDLSPGRTSSSNPETLSNSTVRLRWDSVSGADYYDFGISVLGNDGNWSLIVDTTSTGTSYSRALQSGRSYRWNIRACRNNGQCSAWSSRRYFRTP